MNEQEPHYNPPVNLVMPNVSQLKMEAILELSKACRDVAAALVSVQVAVTISNNTIKTGAGETAINVQTKNDIDPLA